MPDPAVAAQLGEVYMIASPPRQGSGTVELKMPVLDMRPLEEYVSMRLRLSANLPMDQLTVNMFLLPDKNEVFAVIVPGRNHYSISSAPNLPGVHPPGPASPAYLKGEDSVESFLTSRGWKGPKFLHDSTALWEGAQALDLLELGAHDRASLSRRWLFKPSSIIRDELERIERCLLEIELGRSPAGTCAKPGCSQGQCLAGRGAKPGCSLGQRTTSCAANLGCSQRQSMAGPGSTPRYSEDNACTGTGSDQGQKQMKLITSTGQSQGHAAIDAHGDFGLPGTSTEHDAVDQAIASVHPGQELPWASTEGTLGLGEANSHPGQDLPQTDTGGTLGQAKTSEHPGQDCPQTSTEDTLGHAKASEHPGQDLARTGAERTLGNGKADSARPGHGQAGTGSAGTPGHALDWPRLSAVPWPQGHSPGPTFRWLDVGCGSGRDIAWLSTRPGCQGGAVWHITGVDFWLGALQRAQRVLNHAGVTRGQVDLVHARVDPETGRLAVQSGGSGGGGACGGKGGAAGAVQAGGAGGGVQAGRHSRRGGQGGGGGRSGGHGARGGNDCGSDGEGGGGSGQWDGGRTKDSGGAAKMARNDVIAVDGRGVDCSAVAADRLAAVTGSDAWPPSLRPSAGPSLTADEHTAGGGPLARQSPSFQSAAAGERAGDNRNVAAASGALVVSESVADSRAGALGRPGAGSSRLSAEAPMALLGTIPATGPSEGSGPGWPGWPNISYFHSADPWSARYHVISCVRFLQRSFFPFIQELLLPGGFLLYSTFLDGEGTRSLGRPSGQEHLLAMGELASVFNRDSGFHIVADRVDVLEDGREVCYFVAQKL